jgi:hypothetical protein
MGKPVRLLRAIDLHGGPDVRGIILISLAAMLIWFTFSRVTSWALPYRLRSVEAHQGAIEETWTGRAMAVRDEDVIHAPASGRITLLVTKVNVFVPVTFCVR